MIQVMRVPFTMPCTVPKGPKINGAQFTAAHT
jgi:hypothetical protein